MQIKVKKVLKIILCGIGLGALFILCGIVGMRFERSRQRELAMQKVHVDSIAVVNMDNGVLVGEEYVNYASQLMSFPSEHFTVTGLTDAKTGIENGSYAAYIVVPETFSASVTSIESDPQKVTLSCQYNTKLDEEAKMQAMSDVNAFIALLNSNTAYMYLDAILAEFHQIQDDSSEILANDNIELELLASVNADQLIAAAEPVDEIVVEDDIQPVQLETYTTQNHDLLDSMMSGYTEAVQKGKDDYAAIQANNSEVGQAADDFFATYDSVIQDTASEHAALLAAGRDKLDEAIGAYNMDVDAQGETVQKTIVSLIDQQLVSDQAAVDYQLDEIISDMSNKSGEKLNTLQSQWQEAYRSLKSKADASLDEKLDDCEGNLEDIIQDIYIQGYENGYKKGYEDGCGDILEELDGQRDTIKNEVDDDSDPEAIINKVLEIIEQIEPGDIPESDFEDHIDDFNKNIENELSDIGIEWDQLGVVLPPLYGSASDGTDSGDGDDSVDMPGAGDGEDGRDKPDSGDGEDNKDNPDPGDGEGSGDNPDPGDGEGSGDNPDPGDGEGGGDNPDPGDGEGGGDNPDPGDGDKPDPGDDKEYKISLTVFEGNEEAVSSAVTDTLQLFKLEPQLEEISNITQTYFVDALSAESQRQLSRLTDVGQQLNQSMDSYESRLMSYDPMQYIENADLSTYLSGIESNTGEMMDSVEQNNTDYMLYASEMYSTTTEHTSELKSSLDEANTQTTANVENCINGLISSRQTVNNINVDMLKGFTELLSYTRVESQGNTEVYDHIVNPVTSQVKGQASADTQTDVPEEGISAKFWIILILSVGILLCLTEILNGIRRQHRKQNDGTREVL